MSYDAVFEGNMDRTVEGDRSRDRDAFVEGITDDYAGRVEYGGHLNMLLVMFALGVLDARQYEVEVVIDNLPVHLTSHPLPLPLWGFLLCGFRGIRRLPTFPPADLTESRMKLRRRPYDIMDIEILNRYAEEKKLKVQAHPSENLLIWNYSEVTQFKKLWDDVTFRCRGLVTDTSGNIVARSFSKFFNENERSYDATPDFTVYSKVDGSLGILFCYRGKWIIASRGSFTSPQAAKAQLLLNDRYPGLTENLDPDLAYSFEIIYPENRIVVNYGTDEKLIYLAAFRRDGTEIFSAREIMISWGVEVVTELDQTDVTDFADLLQRDIDNEEGYVVRFSNGIRIKIKFPRYVALHRVVSNTNSPWVLSQYASGRRFEEICEHLPDEFFKWAKIAWANIDSAYRSMLSEVQEMFTLARAGSMTRSDFAKKVNGSVYKSALFDLYTGKDPQRRLIKLIDPQQMEPVSVPSSMQRHGVPRKPVSGFARPHLIILYGLPGMHTRSFSEDYIANHWNSVVIDRDSLYQSIFASASPTKNNIQRFAEREKITTALEVTLIRNALLRGNTVLVSSPKLSLDHIDRLLAVCPLDCIVGVRVFNDTDVSEYIKCLVHDHVNEKGMKREYKIVADNASQLETSVETVLAKRNGWKQDANMEPAYVFDIDGTLAIRGDRSAYDRSAYDESKVLLDLPNADVVTLARSLNGSGQVLHICTGRSEGCRADTEKWLLEHGIQYRSLHMRPKGDSRPDYVVKEAMWKRINVEMGNYIIVMYDDRSRVVHHARTLGYTVAQVAYGEF
ncbi:hypothetical protein HDU86_000449 [Geranomyces michiganensis]|nr:hypothetical protein HDU86_000449 [Geranomyces michiganensis]